MYSTYPYSSYSSGPDLSGFALAFTILSCIALIAAIVCAVILYKRYVSQKDEPLIKFSDKQTWGPYLRFERLAIDRILKALYLFLATNCAFSYVAIVIASIFSGSIGIFLAALFFGFIGLVIGEILVRLVFESTMLLVIVTNNTNAIRTTLDSGRGSIISPLVSQPSPTAPTPAPATPTQTPTAATSAEPIITSMQDTVAAAPAAATAPTTPQPAPAPTPEPAPAPTPEPAPEPAPAPEPTFVNPDGSWTCPKCGSTDNRGNFCKHCGTARPER